MESAKEKNITPEEIKGLKVAREITEDGTVIIRPTDKTSKHCIDSSPNYANKMDEHIKDDLIITEKEKERCVRECNGHAAFWRRMVNLGEGHPVKAKSTTSSHDFGLPCLHRLSGEMHH